MEFICAERNMDGLAGKNHERCRLVNTAGRLTDVVKNGSVTNYQYDSNNNRLSQTRDGQTITATYDEQDRLIRNGDIEYSYNANGDLTKRLDGSF